MYKQNTSAVSQDKHGTSDLKNPLELISEALKTDMDAVNAAIIEHMHSPVPLIPQLAGYLIAAGGKRIRPLMTLACTQIFSGNMMRAHGLSAAVEFIHTATLLHDDVVDESEQRRGQDAANLVFGNQASVLVGDFLFSRAFQLMVADGSLDVLKILSDASATIAEGEILQLSAAGQVETSMETYIKIISAKTAALFEAACAVGPVIAGSDSRQVTAMAEFGLNLGIAFQITDDALDYDADQVSLGKVVGDDFREGKMTAPVLLAYQDGTDEEKVFWARVIGFPQKQKPDDLAQAQDILMRHDAIKRSLDIARQYGDKAKEALKSAPECNLKSCLSDLVTYTVYRSS